MNINYVKNGKNEFETTKLIDKYDLSLIHI